MAEADLVEGTARLLALRLEYAYMAEKPPAATELPSPLEERLTAREREILCLLARGHTNREIGDQLVISVRTVEWHRGRLQWKLGVQSRADLFRVATGLGLLAA